MSLSALIVMDEFADRHVVETSLRANPSVVRHSFTAGGTEAARRLLARERFDMVFVDLDLDGCPQLLSELRGDAQYSALPFVGMSHNTDEEQVERLLSSGLDAFLSKPLKRDVVRAEIEEIAGLRSGQSALQTRPV
ncbi:response regulator [Paludibaculum fermentans]|uniref:Response regulator n=1 Tax=Paludibaculum fermentans TaxID=1473598 RepID=A0A7S7SLU6_PALFE|nr:response regulator [Paludibaculum fermentans]QOY88836.1 response regulator [Paludibaculum fermentans]